MNFNSMIQKIEASNLSDTNKARAIRMLQAIRTFVHAIRRIVRALIAAIKEHKDALRILAIALLLAVLLKMIPWVGCLLAFMVILLGAGVAFIVEIRKALNGIFNFGSLAM